jgi:hypothetical protein
MKRNLFLMSASHTCTNFANANGLSSANDQWNNKKIDQSVDQ